MLMIGIFMLGVAVGYMGSERIDKFVDFMNPVIEKVKDVVKKMMHKDED